jgi:hypothetical protein
VNTPEIWTPEAIERARGMWNGGVPMGEITAALGTPAEDVRDRMMGTPRGHLPAFDGHSLALELRFEMFRPLPPPRQLAVGALPESAPCHWRFRRAGQCAWPIGDGLDLLSCCAPITRARVPFCEGHMAVAYTQPEKEAA